MLFKSLVWWVAAFLFAAIMPAIFVAMLGGSLQVVLIAFSIALGHAVILGLPLALLFHAKRWINAISSIGAGFLVGILPAGIFTWPLLHGPDQASVDGVPTVVDGMPTLAGWISYAQFLAFLGACGALAGLTFWLILKFSSEKADQATTQPQPKSGSRRDSTRIGIGIASAGVLLVGAIVAIRSITKDRTCHNMFRDGRSSIGPKVNMDLKITVDEWSRLAEFFERFGATQGLSYRNANESRPNVFETLGLSLCSEQGINILAIDQRWEGRKSEPLGSDHSVAIGVYEATENSDWRRLAQDFIAELNTAWPGKVEFEDKDGRVIPMPEELRK
jgi:hypothetical protein